jgi:hypothetical protein
MSFYFDKGKTMNKLLAALIAGLFAVSVNAFAADAAPKADAADAPAAEKAAAPAAKHSGKHAKKAAPKTEAAKPAEAAPAAK